MYKFFIFNEYSIQCIGKYQIFNYPDIYEPYNKQILKNFKVFKYTHYPILSNSSIQSCLAIQRVIWILAYLKMELSSCPSQAKSSTIKTKNKITSKKSTQSALKLNRSRPKFKTVAQVRNDILYKKFQQFSIAQSCSKIFAAFQRSINRHIFNFKQQWEVSNKFQNKNEYGNSTLFGFLDFILLLVLNFCIFGISIKVFFQIENSEWIYQVAAGICAYKIIKNLPSIVFAPSRYKILTVIIEIICIVLSIILAIFQSQTKWLSFLGLAILLLLYIKTCKVYDKIKIFHVSSKYRQVVEIIDLFVLLLAVSHIFALILYSITHLNPESNWLTRINMQNQSWHVKYIYSLYFSCTTLLTVGYGDLSPTNVAQILTILLTEFIGIATFAYAVNKIGAALSNITQRAQKLQKDLGNVETIGNQYKLNPQLICRMRTQLTKDKALDAELNTNQQNELFTKFSQDLREQISVESSMRVIKRSMFMIGNWTGKLQSKIARKLVKEIYAIDEFLPQYAGKQKIYILDKGKVDVITNARSGFKVCFQKVLKTLNVASSNQVLVSNVYGFSAVISNRQIHLNAVAKSNSICYSLSRNDLYELLAQSQEDLQHFHELKSKIDLSKIPQQIEAPSIINFREHYCPSVHYVIAQNYYKQNKNNQRKRVIRNKRKLALKCYNDFLGSTRIISRKQKIMKSCKDQIYSISKFQELDQPKQQFNDKNSDIIDENMVGFQSCKQFQRYYKNSNYQKVLGRLKTKICKTSLRPNKQQPFKLKQQQTTGNSNSQPYKN